MNNYNISVMNFDQAKFIIEKIHLTRNLNYPEDSLEFKEILHQIYFYLLTNMLTDTEIYIQINKKLSNLNFLFSDPKISNEVFYHMKILLSSHASLIAHKFNLIYF